MEIIWAPTSEFDLQKFFQHFTKAQARSSEELFTQIETAAGFISELPSAGSPVGHDGLRKWPVGDLPFILIYEIRADQVHILHLRHVASDWHSLL